MFVSVQILDAKPYWAAPWCRLLQNLLPRTHVEKTSSLSFFRSRIEQRSPGCKQMWFQRQAWLALRKFAKLGELTFSQVWEKLRFLSCFRKILYFLFNGSKCSGWPLNVAMVYLFVLEIAHLVHLFFTKWFAQHWSEITFYQSCLKLLQVLVMTPVIFVL